MLSDWSGISVMEDEYGREIETNKISDNLTITIKKTEDRRKIIIEAVYCDKFKLSRGYANNYEGREAKDEFLDNIDSDDKIRKYFGI